MRHKPLVEGLVPLFLLHIFYLSEVLQLHVTLGPSLQLFGLLPTTSLKFSSTGAENQGYLGQETCSQVYYKILNMYHIT